MLTVPERPGSPASTAHPLDSLDAAEIADAVAILRAERTLGPRTRIVTVSLREPTRQELRQYRQGVPLERFAEIVLLDNAALGLVRQQQTLFYGRRLVASHFSQPGDFPGIARAFGIPAIDLETCSAPHGTLSRALNGDGPILIRVPIGADEHVLPMVAPGSGNVEAIDHENHSDPISVSC